MGNMEYATSVLISLLFCPMEKAVSTKHPFLMLRRTESVVEKMPSNWMAVSLYHYLKDRAGQSIFVLFKTIKYQVEKGPVDSLTHDANEQPSEVWDLEAEDEPLLDAGIIVGDWWYNAFSQR